MSRLFPALLFVVASFALVGAPGVSLAESVPAPIPSESADPAAIPPGVSQEKLFSISEISFFVDTLIENQDGLKSLDGLQLLNGDTFGAN